MTGPGPDQNEMLWPVAPVWPPEVDFNEMGYSTNVDVLDRPLRPRLGVRADDASFNMERWHTWGLIWTPTSMTFTIDGEVLGRAHQLG